MNFRYYEAEYWPVPELKTPEDGAYAWCSLVEVSDELYQRYLKAYEEFHTVRTMLMDLESIE